MTNQGTLGLKLVVSMVASLLLVIRDANTTIVTTVEIVVKEKDLEKILEVNSHK